MIPARSLAIPSLPFRMPDRAPAVFLSYASQDADAARRIAEALRAAGIEVWFDQSELRGGDAWDQKIKAQIKACALFVPIVSANTQNRHEGYFRLEWHLAEQRSHLIARGRPFIVPVAIDDTRDTEALVPDAFLAVQWMRLPDGTADAAFAERLATLLAGKPVAGVVDPGPASTRPATANVSRVRSSRLAWLAGTAVVLAGAAAFFLIRPSVDVGPAASVSPAGQPALSEADRLVARATAILDGSALSPEQIGAANDLAAQAMVLDPSHAGAWTTAARADLLLIHPYGYDQSEARRQQAMSRATRALNLAPDSLATRVVHTSVMAHASRNRDVTREAEETFRRLIREHPGNIDLQIRLAEVLREQQRFDEAAAVFTSIGEFELAAWSWFQGGQNAAAYDQVKHAVVARRTTSALNLKSRLEADWFQDLAAAAATTAEFRPSELREELNAASAVRIAFLRREPERMLQIVNALSRDLMESHAYVGPRQYWTGWAHHLAGRSEWAAIEWRKAISILQAERARVPGHVMLFDLEAEIHALLGEKEEAARLLDAAQRIVNETPKVVSNRNHRVHLALGHRDQVLAWLTSFLQEKPEVYWYMTHAHARFSPAWDGLRGDPRFEALLRETMPADAKPFEDQKTENRGPQSDDPAARLPANDKSVAVLAFANLSSDKEQEYFSDGISEELLNVLAKVPGLKVSARTSAFFFKGKEVPVPEIAKQLGVAYVVEGSVRKQGDKVRITAQLIKAADGFQMWSDTFTRDLKDIFAVQDEIAGLIAQNLQLKLGESARAKKVVDPEAHQLVLKGRHYWALRGEANLGIAEDAYQRALQLDPLFAEAHAGMADVWMIRAWYRTMAGGGPTVAEDLGRAEEAIQRATTLDPSLAEPHATLGTVRFIEGKFAEAEPPFQRAFELNPNYAVGRHWHGVHLMSIGRFDTSLAELREATRLDPLAPMPLWTLAAEFNIINAPAEAYDAADRALRLRPDFLPLLSEKALAAWSLGRRDDALAAARAIAANTSSTEARWWADADAVYVLLQAGEVEEARRHADRVFARISPDDYRRPFVLAALGRFEEALAAQAVIPTTALIRLWSSPIWEPVRQDPRFHAMVERLGYMEEFRSSRATLAKLARQAPAKP